MLSDFPTIVYVLTVIVSCYGFGLFVWWWNKNKHASEVYIYVTLLFLAIGLANGIALYARLLLILEDDHSSFVRGFLWEMRIVPILVILSLIVIRMTQRVLRRGQKDDYDKREDV